jgi:type VI secretion system protein VasD
MTFIASRNINRDEDGQPRPVEVRVYQLRSDSRLLSASFEDLWKDDKTTLRDDLVGVDEFPAYPGTRSETKFRASADAHFLAAVGLFRSPLGRSFWTEFEMPASIKDHCAPSPLSFAVYIDQTRLAEGSDHMEDHPDKTRVREVELHFDSPSAGSARGEDPSAHDQGRQP